MTSVLHWWKLAGAMGWRYVIFRVLFEVKRKSGLLRFSFPVSPDGKTWISLNEWRLSAPTFFFHSRANLTAAQSDELAGRAKRILNYEIPYFNGRWRAVSPDDWLTNPITGYQYDPSRHWTRIPDFHPVYGDIKYVWERSRFSFLQTILRYDAAYGQDSSGWVFGQIENWVDHNPINCGPNYRCSQEISLRVMNWTLALYFYRDSVALTPALFSKILFHVYWQVKHVRGNIQFSRVAVRNNHAITETLMLYTAGLLFPFFEESKDWKALGKKWFEEEIAYQIYEDGTYLQFSFNYHRVVIQLLTWAFALAEKHGETFPEVVYQRAYASLQVLMQSQDPVSGQLPNYGANDGSLFFQWNDEPFRSYRPALDALHYLITSVSAYSSGFEDRNWFGLGSGVKKFPAVFVKSGVFSFPIGGIYGFRDKDMLCWVVCPSYRSRPSQADALHLDLWYKGKNLLCDAGSYQYNTDAATVKYFMGTESHNTVMLGESDQMIKGPRFIWLAWTKSNDAGWHINHDQLIFKGVAQVYRYLGSITQKREVKIDLTQKIITIKDDVAGSALQLRQLWHVSLDYAKYMVFTSSAGTARKESVKFHSPTYGVKESCIQLEFRTFGPSIITQVRLL